MTLTEPQIPDTARLPIGEAAKVLGINRLSLRKKTIDGLVKCGYRKVSKNATTARKFYIGAELKRFWRSQL